MDRTSDGAQRPRKRRSRLPRRPQGHPSDSIVQTLLVLVVVGSALAVGTVRMEALIPIAAIALIGGTLATVAQGNLPKPAIVLGALGLFSAVQAVPVASGWVLRVSPAAAEVWLRCLVPFGEGTLSRFPVSLDAGASLAEALKWLTYAAVYLMAARVRAQRGSIWLATVLFGSATLVAIIPLMQGVADSRVLYGIYQPNFSVGRWNVGPFLNSNNLAGYTLLGLAAGTGLLLSGQSPLPRAGSLGCLSVITTALLLSGSRAAIVSALAAGTIIFFWLIKARRFRVTRSRLAWGALPLLFAAGLAVALGSSKDFGALTSTDMRRKVAAWSWSLPMIRDHAWFGVGRGAFETAFPPYRRVLDYDWTAVFTHAENFVLQWVAEWGIPVGGCAVILVVGYVLREWFWSRRERLHFVLLCGIAALLLQNLADLGLEVPGLMIAAVVTLAGGERPAVRRAAHSTAAGIPILPLALAVPMLVVWLAAVQRSRWPVEVERRELAISYRELPTKITAEDSAMFRDRLRDAVLRHPGESFFPLLGSLAAFRTPGGRPLPWISRALELAPSNGRVHLVVAQMLGAHRATRQAMLHLRLAAESDATLAEVAGLLALRWAPSVDVLLQAIPQGSPGNAMLAAACTKEARVEVKIECFRQALTRAPNSGGLHGDLAEALLTAVRTTRPPCDGIATEKCAEEAERNLRALSVLEPKSWRPGYLMAKLLLIRGDATGAIKLLARVCPPSAEGNECAREAVAAAIKSGSDEAILLAANSYASRSCDSGTSCAASLDWLGASLDAGGKLAFAIEFYSRAAELDGTAARWLRIAERAAKANLYGIARTALDRADHSPDANPNSRAHTALLMRRVAQGLGPAGL